VCLLYFMCYMILYVYMSRSVILYLYVMCLYITQHKVYLYVMCLYITQHKVYLHVMCLYYIL